MRLICLDDDPRIEAVLGRFLKRFGHAVDFHVSIASFKAALASDTPELVLLDLGLGRENGIDVIHWLSETHPGFPSFSFPDMATICSIPRDASPARPESRSSGRSPSPGW
ncbi:MAG: hypothetical protein KFB96_00035 [Thiocapsa sp.]|uniref:response regulator n=1 Tax=Thiocapsa sp. TaxID=2024551 RepID=UPI001BCAD7CF|nr:response regulator [Thiocapsa sp.]QVL48977.1 MAG: hypothetical protein KFB96_00035 [Thiocapsa sp.]